MKPSINGINVPLKITKFRATCVNIPTKAEFCFKMWEFKKYLVTFDCYLSENLTRYRYLLPQRYYITVPSLPNTGHDNHKLNHTTTNKYTVTTQNSACQIWLKEGCRLYPSTTWQLLATISQMVVSVTWLQLTAVSGYTVQQRQTNEP